MAFTNLIGKRFSRLVVVEQLESRKGPLKRGFARWRCVCDCGKETIAETSRLNRGHKKSCGCLAATAIVERTLTHGMTGTSEYRIWSGLKRRCLDPVCNSYPRYGGRGITVCEEWMDFASFFADMGPRPSKKHSLDRINNNGPYSPENCRWATAKDQARNTSRSRRYAFHGKRLTIPDIAEQTGIPRMTLFNRLRSGVPVALAADPKFDARRNSPKVKQRRIRERPEPRQE